MRDCKEVFFLKKEAKTFVIMGLALILAGAARAANCDLAGQRLSTRVTLYFGRDRTGMAEVSDAEWTRFSVSELTATFPDGFTESDGVGQWRDPKSGQIVREHSKIVDVVVDGTGLAAKIATVTGDYRQQFRQQSVGVVTERVCAVF